MVRPETPFWEKPLSQLNRDEWEQLCDGCARCCLIKLHDEEDETLYITSIACRYLDQDQCRCGCYQDRSDKVPECITVTEENIGDLWWMPSTCTYRLRAEGKPLPPWHPLISGDKDSIHHAGISIRYLATLEDQVEGEDLEAFIIEEHSI